MLILKKYLFEKNIYINFEYLIKKNLKAINSNIKIIIKKYYNFYNILINSL